MFSSAMDDPALRCASVYERALGASFDALDPLLRVYFGPIPYGAVGRGEGTFDEAGFTGPALLRPLIRLFANRRVLFPERESDVPFSIENRVDGAGALRADRVFAFSRRSRRMSDAMTPGPRGTIIDRLGRRGSFVYRIEPSGGTPPTGVRTPL